MKPNLLGENLTADYLKNLPLKCIYFFFAFGATLLIIGVYWLFIFPSGKPPLEADLAKISGVIADVSKITIQKRSFIKDAWIELTLKHGDSKVPLILRVDNFGQGKLIASEHAALLALYDSNQPVSLRYDPNYENTVYELSQADNVALTYVAMAKRSDAKWAARGFTGGRYWYEQVWYQLFPLLGGTFFIAVGFFSLYNKRKATSA